ncbi:hypothetical protein DID74_02395 [Candidatus Marinamargulisbacteria bacterium SCGC AG-333-B06]|nr:hypothetical protein DID74_02395 [Candidatus Marinamargulisbacteria bacterium SCGC AG-333-B06]
MKPALPAKRFVNPIKINPSLPNYSCRIDKCDVYRGHPVFSSEDISSHIYDYCKQKEILNLQVSHTTHRHLDHIKHLYGYQPNLYSKVPESSIFNNLNQFCFLKHLTLNRYTIDQSFIDSLPTSIQSLSLNCNEKPTLLDLNRLKNLETLFLSPNLITKEQVDCLPTQLKSLDFWDLDREYYPYTNQEDLDLNSEGALRGADLTEVSFAHLTNLEKLTLNGSRNISQQHLIQVAGSLKSLGFRVPIQADIDFSVLNKLERIDIKDTNILPQQKRQIEDKIGEIKCDLSKYEYLRN